MSFSHLVKLNSPLQDHSKTVSMFSINLLNIFVELLQRQATAQTCISKLWRNGHSLGNQTIKADSLSQATGYPSSSIDPAKHFRCAIIDRIKRNSMWMSKFKQVIRGKTIGVPRLTGNRKDFCEPNTLLRTSAKANGVSTNRRTIAKKSSANPQNIYNPHMVSASPQIPSTKLCKRQ